MEEKKEAKIIVKTTDELSDIVEKISSSVADRIVLTFTETSDLLVSSINLSVLKETAQESNKSLIAQIIKNPTGERNAEKAELKTINTPTNPSESLWEEVEKGMKEMKMEKEEKLGQRVTKEEEVVEEPEKSSFQQRVEDALKKSKAQPTSAINKTKFVEEEGVKISLDSEIPKEGIKNAEDLIKEDNIKKESFEKPSSQAPTSPTKMTGEDIKPKEFIQTKPSKPDVSLKERFLKILPKKKLPSDNSVIKMKKIRIPKKYLLIGGVSLVLILVTSCSLYYYLAPLVKIRLYVDSKSVEIEKSFSGSSEISTVNLEDELVPITTEEVEEDASDSITPTGTSVTGEKAVGSVRINYLEIGETLTLSSGAVITTEGLSFVTQGDLTLVGPNWGEVSVQASEYGENYNISSGSYFTVAGYSDSVLSGSALDDFTGGSKTEVTVLSQTDVDSAAEELAKIAKEGAEGELLEKHDDDGWEIIEGSVTSDVDEESVETDVAIGAEATTANISLSVTVSAIYYNQEALEDLIDDMLSEEAKNKDLFAATGDIELELAEEIDTDFTVTGKTTASIKVKVQATGVVTPKVDKNNIIETLNGKNWGEGLNTLTSFDYSDQEIQVDFDPSFFPDWMKYFPSRQGRILISMVYVEEEDTVEAE